MCLLFLTTILISIIFQKTKRHFKIAKSQLKKTSPLKFEFGDNVNLEIINRIKA